MKKLFVIIICSLIVSCSLFGGDKEKIIQNYDKKITELTKGLKQTDLQIRELLSKRERIVGAIKTLQILKQELK